MRQGTKAGSGTSDGGIGSWIRLSAARRLP